MSAAPPPSRPRLVRPDEPPPSSAGSAPARPGGGRAWLLALALAVALVAAGGWGLTAQRAATLEARVGALEAALAATRSELDAARSEIGARQRHLEALRGAAADLEARVAALRALADRGAAAPAVPPAAEQAPTGPE